MDLQADIKWIKSELNQVTDQNLIEAFKQLLTYRKNKVDESNLEIQKEMVASAIKSNEDIKSGRTYSIEQAENRLENRLGA
jgi:hypothetical protein